MTPGQKAAFAAAAARWETIITNEAEDAFSDTPLGAGACGSNSYRIPANLVIDDLLIFASVVPIDGPGNVLGSAGPCFVRQATTGVFAVGDFPVIGQMRFDSADMSTYEANGQLSSIILHEMGHVIGFGTLWDPNVFNLVKNPSTPTSAQDTYFPGANAIIGFNEIGFGSYPGNKVPVANVGGSGTVNAHWRENVLTRELMTGFIDVGNNPLTAVSIRSMADLGYTVNVGAADSYTSPPSFSVTPAPGKAVAPLHLVNDVYTGPLYGLDRRGRVVRIR
jgi:hypothetical protein